MTISTTTSKALGLGDGVTTAFTYSFFIPNSAALQVTFIDAQGAQTVLGSGAYSVSGLGSKNGGTVTYPLAGAPMAAGTALVIERIVPFTQPTSLTNQGGYFPASVEGAFDNLEMQIQQLAGGSRNSSLALTFPSIDVSPQTVLPGALARANRYLAFDAQGNPVMMTGTSASPDVSTSTVTSTGSTTSRSLAARAADKINVLDYNAKGDGGTDDTAAIQAAANVASGKVLYFPGGKTYVVSSVSLLANTILELHGAIIKQKVLGNLVGSAVFVVTDTGCQFHGGTITGQRASQPANGFSDSFNGGANGTGRSFRCAILADAVAHASIASLIVRGVTITQMYGAGVCTRDVSNVAVEDCTGTQTNFELAWLGWSGGGTQPQNASIQRNTCFQIASGDATVNADSLYCSHYLRAVVMGNRVSQGERCMVKVESADILAVVGNVGDSSTIANFYGIQYDGLSGGKYALIANNVIYNYAGGGILLSQGTYEAVDIIGNVVHTTGGTVGDGISVTANTAGAAITIADNTLYNLKRDGIYVAGVVANLVVSGNNCHGQGLNGQYGLTFTASSTWTGATIVKNNLFRNFEQSAVGLGPVNFANSGGALINLLIFQGNTVMAGAAANRGVRTSGLDLFPAGIFSDNYIEGQLELYSAGMHYRNNTVTGAQTTVGTTNVSVPGGDQTTVGGAGGASAVPATPSKYIKVLDGGVSYVIPAYLPS